MEDVQKLSQAQANVLIGLAQHYLSTGDNPKDGLTLEDLTAKLLSIDETQVPAEAPLINGILDWLRPIIQATPTLWDDMVLKIVDGVLDSGLIALIKAAVARRRAKRALKKDAKESVN